MCTGQSDEEQNSPVGIVRILPFFCIEELVRAADKARELPVKSLQRVLVIEEAIERCKLAYPEYFRS